MRIVKKALLSFVLVGVMVIGGLFATRVINKDFSVDKVKLVTDMPSIRDSILQHQKDARYVPYKMRLILFNNSVYIYQILRNIANFWSLDNINKIMLLANVYPAMVGLRALWLRQKEKFWTCILAICAGSIVIGLNKMVDARAATWFMMPILGYLIIKGLSKINLKVYVPLLIVSMFLLM